MAKDLRYLGPRAFFKDLARPLNTFELLTYVPDVIADKLLQRSDFMLDADINPPVPEVTKPKDIKDFPVTEETANLDTDTKPDDSAPVFTKSPK